MLDRTSIDSASLIADMIFVIRAAIKKADKSCLHLLLKRALDSDRTLWIPFSIVPNGSRLQVREVYVTDLGICVPVAHGIRGLRQLGAVRLVDEAGFDPDILVIVGCGNFSCCINFAISFTAVERLGFCLRLVEISVAHVCERMAYGGLRLSSKNPSKRLVCVFKLSLQGSRRALLESGKHKKVGDRASA